MFGETFQTWQARIMERQARMTYFVIQKWENMTELLNLIQYDDSDDDVWPGWDDDDSDDDDDRFKDIEDGGVLTMSKVPAY